MVTFFLHNNDSAGSSVCQVSGPSLGVYNNASNQYGVLFSNSMDSGEDDFMPLNIQTYATLSTTIQNRSGRLSQSLKNRKGIKGTQILKEEFKPSLFTI